MLPVRPLLREPELTRRIQEEESCSHVSPMRSLRQIGMYLLIDRKSGKGVSLTLWESEEKLRAAETALNQQRDQVVQTGGSGAPASSEVFEVIE